MWVEWFKADLGKSRPGNPDFWNKNCTYSLLISQIFCTLKYIWYICFKVCSPSASRYMYLNICICYHKNRQLKNNQIASFTNVKWFSSWLCCLSCDTLTRITRDSNENFWLMKVEFRSTQYDALNGCELKSRNHDLFIFYHSLIFIFSKLDYPFGWLSWKIIVETDIFSECPNSLWLIIYDIIWLILCSSKNMVHTGWLKK